MPILKLEELTGFLGKQIATLITNDPKSFALAEQSASALLHIRTGFVVPDDADDAPLWAKEAVAFMIQMKRSGSLANLTPARVQLIQQQYNQAMQTLDQNKLAAPTNRPGAEYGQMEGTIQW